MAPMSNYPNGFVGDVSIRGVPVLSSYPGKVFWVDSVHGSDGNRGTFQRPLATITKALSFCTADAGDIIVLKSGHAEAVSAAGGIALNKNGVAILGLGQGTDRPTLTFGTAVSASVLITGDNTTIQNIVGLSGIDQLTQPFDVRAKDVQLDIEWQDTAANKEALRAVLTTAACVRLNAKIKYKGQTGGSHNLNVVKLVGVAGARLNIDFNGKASTAVVEFATTACSDVVVTGYVYNSGTTDGSKTVVDTITGSTWFASVYDGTAGTSFNGGSGLQLNADTASLQSRVAVSATAVMVNGNTLFTVAGGPILIESLVSVCIAGNDATASTLQYQSAPTIGTATTISGASASLANAAAGATVSLQGTALATAALYAANGPSLVANPGTIIAPAGTIKAVVGVGSTTGTWKHYIRYKPLVAGVTVS